jgi:hypothetical protein
MGLMSDNRVEVRGEKQLQQLISNLQKAGDNQLAKMLAEGAFSTENEAKRSIQGHQSAGATYKRRGVMHTASRPGNPPNTDTGNLVNNITVNKIAGGYDVGSRAGAPYGLWLEYGTLRIAPRPWLRPVFEKVIKQLVEKYARKGLL